MFIVIDGLDGSGKSTQALLLASHIQSRGSTLILRSHPSKDSFFGTRARGYLFLSGRRAHIAASLFYLADVARSLLLYSWRRVDYIVFVRYLMGTAYLPSPLHKLFYLLLSRLVPAGKPSIYLKVDPSEAHRRVVAGRGRKERFESMVELCKTASKAADLVSYGDWIVVDGRRPPEEVHRDILRLAGLA